MVLLKVVWIVRTVRAVMLIAVTATGFASRAEVVDEKDFNYNEVTIRPSDYPHDAPRFEHFPVEVFRGVNALPDLKSHPRSRLYRTRIRDAAKLQPNFAGHYVLTSWGCGTDCSEIAIIDVIDGKVYHPPGFTYFQFQNIHYKLSDRAFKHRDDSELLIIAGFPEERTKDRGISFLVWRDNKFKRVRFVKKAWYDER